MERTMNKTKEQIITDMCYTWRHDYGLKKYADPGGYSFPFTSGMTDEERQQLYNSMKQVFENAIEPYVSLNMFLDGGCAERGCAMKDDFK